MTSKIVVNNVGADVGIASVHFDSNIQRGTSNLHSTGLNVSDTFLHSTGLNVGTGATIHQPADNVMTLGTNGSERLRIDSDGRVLIGTTNNTSLGSIDQNVIIGSTTNAEEVALTLNVMEGTNNRRAKFFLDDDDGVFGIDATASTGVPDFVVRSATSEKFRITAAGLVGIGTNTPYNPLAVVGSSADIMVYDTDNYSQNVSGGAVAFAGKDSAGNRKTLADVRGVANGSNIGEFAIRTRRTGGTLTEALRIDSSGRVTKSAHPSFYARRSIAGDGRAGSTSSAITEWTNPGSETSGNPNHNRGGHFNHSTGLFTAPVSGIYHFSAAAGYKQNSVSFNQKFIHNGVLTSEGVRFIGAPDSHSTATISATVYMAAGNTMGVLIEYTHHANTTHNFFSGHLVG